MPACFDISVKRRSFPRVKYPKLPGACRNNLKPRCILCVLCVAELNLPIEPLTTGTQRKQMMHRERLHFLDRLGRAKTIFGAIMVHKCRAVLLVVIGCLGSTAKLFGDIEVALSFGLTSSCQVCLAQLIVDLMAFWFQF